MGKFRPLLTFATLLGPVALIVAIVSFATDHWVDTNVDKSKLTVIEKDLSNQNQALGRVYNSRNRGLLRECFPGADATFLDQASGVIDTNCFSVDMDMPSEGGYSKNFEMRIHLIRAMFACFIVALVCIMVSFIAGIILCCHISIRSAAVAAVGCLLAAILMLVSLVTFHVAEKIQTSHTGDFGEVQFKNNWSQSLQVATRSEYGFSYAMAWLAVVVAGIDGVVYIMVIRVLPRQKIIEDKKSNASDRQSVIPNKSPKYDESGFSSGIVPMPMYLPASYPATMDPAMLAMPGYNQTAHGNGVYAVMPPEYASNSVGI